MPNSNNQQRPFPVLDTMLNSFADWVNNYRSSMGHGAGLAQVDRDELVLIARDLGVSTDELRTLSSRGPKAADLVHKMLLALGVDPKVLFQTDPLVMRDLQRLCSTCGDKGRCAHELAEGTAAAHFHEFCPNAFTLEALSPNKAKTVAH